MTRKYTKTDLTPKRLADSVSITKETWGEGTNQTTFYEIGALVREGEFAHVVTISRKSARDEWTIGQMLVSDLTPPVFMALQRALAIVSEECYKSGANGADFETV